MTRVLVWAGSAVTRAGLEALLRESGRLDLARPRQRTTLEAAVYETKADVVLMTSEPGMRAPAELPGCVVIVQSASRAEVLRLLRAGARGVLLSDAGADEIVAAVESAAAGSVILSEELLDEVLPPIAEANEAGESAAEPLTTRESEVLALMADGAGNKEIATRLGISEHTAKFHVSSVLNKLGAATRTEAVMLGLKRGLLLI